MKDFLRRIHKKKADSLLARKKTQQAMQHYRKAGDSEGQAKAALEDGDFRLAARFHLERGEHEKAAEILENGGDRLKALEIYRRQGMKEPLARLYEAVGRYSSAAELHLEAGRVDKAIELYRAEGDIPGLVLAYKTKGDLSVSAQQCFERGEILLAALLYDLAGEKARAAPLFAQAGMKNKALALYEQIGDYNSIGEIQEGEGRLSLAAEAYEMAEGQALRAAEIFSRLVLLRRGKEIDTKGTIISGVFASSADMVVLGTHERSLVCASRTFETKWHFRIGGIGRPAIVAVTSGGTLVAVATEELESKEGNLVLLINRDKEVLWQQTFDDPVRDILFVKDNTGIVLTTGDLILLCDLQGKVQWRKKADFKPWALALTPDGNHVVAGTLGGNLYRLDMAGETSARIQLEDRVHALRYAPGNTHLAVVEGDGKIILLDSELRKEWETVLPDGVRFIEPLPHTNHLAVAGKNTLALLNLRGEVIDTTRLEGKISVMFADPREEALYLSVGSPGLRRYRLQDCRKRGAECYEKAGDFGKAADLYFQVEEYPKAYELYKEIGDFEKAANTIHLAGDVLRAARHYEVVGRYEKAAELYVEIKQIHLAAKCFGKANQDVKAAALYEQLGDKILAADFYERAGEHKKAGLLFAGINQRDRALENLQKHYETHKDDDHLIYEIGKLHLAGEHYDDAILMFQLLVEKEKYRRDTLLKLGECFMQKGLYEVAIDRFNECLGDDTKPNKKNIDVHYLIGCCHEKAGRFNEAKELFGKILAIDYHYKDIRERHEYSKDMSAVQTRQRTPLPASAASNVTMPFLEVPESVRRYEIIRKLGEGGMGVVYLARDTKLNRQVAWKVLPAHLAANQDYQQRLLREARAAARLMHKHIVAIYDVVSDAQECSITMEYIDGTTLRNKLADKPQLPIPVCLRYAAQIADALKAAHEAGVTHRDVKPENIMITNTTDEVKMADFGLARLDEDVHLTREGCVVGTISYMAPEQIRGEEVDGRVDVYAFGALLFEMLAGRTPYVGKNVLAQHLHNLPPSPRELRGDIAPGLEALILSCLEKDKDARPAGFGHVLESLKSLGAQ